MLFNFKNKEIISMRENFEEKYYRYVKTFRTKSIIYETLNGMPPCHTSDKGNMNSLKALAHRTTKLHFR